MYSKKTRLPILLILLFLIQLSPSTQAATWQSTTAADYNTGNAFDFNWAKVTQDANVLPVGDDRIHNDQNQLFYDANLKGYWKFDDVNSTGNGVRDDTNNANNGLLINGADINAWGMWDTNAAFFDGVNDYIRFGNIPAFKVASKTITWWMNTRDTAASHHMVFSAGTTNYYISRYGTSLRGSWTASDGRQKTLSTPAGCVLPVGQWGHYAVVFDVADPSDANSSVTVTGYANGALISTTTNTEGYGSTYGTKFDISRYAASGTNWFIGEIDELKFYDRALSAAEIQADYNSWMRSNYDSPIKDAGETVQWDNIQWQELVDVNNNVTVDYRSCNDADCDGESWTTGLRGCTAAACNLSAANNRYFQYRVNFDTNRQQWNPIRTGDSDKGVFGHLSNMTVTYTPLSAAVYNIDQNKVCFPFAGGTTSSSSFQTRVSVEQGYVGRGTSSSFAAELGCIYGFENSPPTVGRIRICDGTCDIAKANASPGTWFTLEVGVTDPNGAADVNTERFRVTLFHGSTDTNSCAGGEDWDCNALSMWVKDNNIRLASANGCEQSSGVYCINIPAAAWGTKFLHGDVNIYVAVDDNSWAFDSNAVDKNAFTIVKTYGTSEDATTGAYSAGPNTINNVITTDVPHEYVESTHNGNCDINVTVRGTDLNVSASIFIGDDNQSWKLNSSAPTTSEPFFGYDANVNTDWNRGTYSTSAAMRVFYWLDTPIYQPSGSYTGTLNYGSVASD